MSSGLAEDLQLAVAGLMPAHGFGLVSRLVFVVELIAEDSGELGLLRGSIPASMPVWDELGMHQYALADMQAVVTAARVVDGEEE